MSKIIQISLPEETHKKLKEKAKADYRSLTNYITTQLIKLADDSIQTIDTTALPENTSTTVKIKTQKPLTPDEIEELQTQSFEKLWYEILGKDTEFNPNEHACLEPDNNYFEFAEKQEGKFLRWAWTMPEQKQREYITEWKNYL